MVCLVGMILVKMKKDEMKIRGKIVGKCVWLEGRGKEKMVWFDYFFFESTKLQSLQNREKTREKTFVHVKRIFGLWYFATRSSFFFFLFSFFHSLLVLLPLFTLDFFSSSFILCFLVSSCFPFYTSIFFSFFFASLIFLFLFFLIIWMPLFQINHI